MVGSYIARVMILITMRRMTTDVKSWCEVIRIATLRTRLYSSRSTWKLVPLWLDITDDATLLALPDLILFRALGASSTCDAQQQQHTLQGREC